MNKIQSATAADVWHFYSISQKNKAEQKLIKSRRLRLTTWSLMFYLQSFVLMNKWENSRKFYPKNVWGEAELIICQSLKCFTWAKRFIVLMPTDRWLTPNIFDDDCMSAFCVMVDKEMSSFESDFLFDGHTQHVMKKENSLHSSILSS